MSRTSTNSRKLPHSSELERSLLGGLLQDPSQLPDVAALLTAADFHRPQHQALYQLITDLAEGGGYDLATIMDTIPDRTPERFGGIAYVVTLPNACPSVESVGLYAAKLRDLAIKRKVLLAAWAVIDQGEDPDVSADEMRAALEGRVGAIEGAAPGRAWFTAAEVVAEVGARIEARAAEAKLAEEEGRPAVAGMPTGFPELDDKVQGLHRSNLVIVAGRPASGKTAYSMIVAANVARTGVGVGVFSLEMARHELVERMIAVDGLVEAARLRSGRLDQDDWDRVGRGMDSVAALPIYIGDAAGLTLALLISRATKLKRDHPEIGVFVLDYLQLLEGHGESRQMVLAALTRGLKLLAKSLDVCFVVLSQLNRDCEGRSDKRPQMADLQGSSSIEQDADVIMFIYRDQVYHPDTSDRGIAEIILAKQRAGPIGTVRLAFQDIYVRFASLAAQEVPQ